MNRKSPQITFSKGLVQLSEISADWQTSGAESEEEAVLVGLFELFEFVTDTDKLGETGPAFDVVRVNELTGRELLAASDKSGRFTKIIATTKITATTTKTILPRFESKLLLFFVTYNYSKVLSCKTA